MQVGELKQGDKFKRSTDWGVWMVVNPGRTLDVQVVNLETGKLDWLYYQTDVQLIKQQTKG